MQNAADVSVKSEDEIALRLVRRDAPKLSDTNEDIPARAVGFLNLVFYRIECGLEERVQMTECFGFNE